MRYHQIITLKDGRTCVLRNGTKEDGAICLEIFRRTHEQTDFLLSYPDEITFTPEQQEEYLQKKDIQVEKKVFQIFQYLYVLL